MLFLDKVGIPECCQAGVEQSHCAQNKCRVTRLGLECCAWCPVFHIQHLPCLLGSWFTGLSVQHLQRGESPWGDHGDSAEKLSELSKVQPVIFSPSKSAKQMCFQWSLADLWPWPPICTSYSGGVFVNMQWCSMAGPGEKWMQPHVTALRWYWLKNGIFPEGEL